MESINQTIFLFINGTNPSDAALLIGKILAKYLVYLFPLYLVISWLKDDTNGREALIQAVFSAIVAIFISWLIAKLWFYPRPFVAGIGHQFLEHKPTASFPSNHLSFIWAICMSLYFYPSKRKAAVILALIGLPVAWARVFMGVHYPADMLGALINAIIAAVICLPLRHTITPMTRSLIEPLYRFIFALPIKAGLCKK